MHTHHAPEVRCSAERDAAGHLKVRYQVRNVAGQPIHLLDGRRMPYLLRPEPQTLLLLQGVNPPNPDVLYGMIEVPTSRALAPGETFTREVVLDSLVLRDHYETSNAPLDLHGEVTLRCQVGWGTTPITQAEVPRMSIKQLLSWQQLAEAPPSKLTLP